MKPILEAAKSAREKGGDYWAVYYAARAVADKVVPGAFRAPFRAARDGIDREFVDLVKRLAEMREEA